MPSFGRLSKLMGISKEIVQDLAANSSKLSKDDVIKNIIEKANPESIVHQVKPVMREIHTGILQEHGLEDARDLMKYRGLDPDSLIIDPNLRHYGELNTGNMQLKLRDPKNLGVADHEVQHIYDLLNDPEVLELYKQGKLNSSQGLGSILDKNSKKVLNIRNPQDLKRLELLQNTAQIAKEPGNAARGFYEVPTNEKFIQGLYNEAPDKVEAFKHFEGNHFTGEDDSERILNSLKSLEPKKIDKEKFKLLKKTMNNG